MGRSEKKRWQPWPLIGWDIFDFFSETAERNSTKLDRKQDLNVLYQVFFFFGPIRKTRWPPWPLIGWDIFDFFSETFERNSTKLDRKQDLNVFYQVVFFGPIAKTRWPPWPLIGWDILDFFSEIAERNSTKLDRKQTLNVLYQICVFRADRKHKMAALTSDWLRNFRLLWWNRWMEFKETWQEARSKSPLPNLCLSGWSEKKWPPQPLIGWDIFDFFSETAERNSTKLDRK